MPDDPEYTARNHTVRNGMELLGWAYTKSDRWRFDAMIVPHSGLGSDPAPVLLGGLGLSAGLAGAATVGLVGPWIAAACGAAMVGGLGAFLLGTRSGRDLLRDARWRLSGKAFPALDTIELVDPPAVRPDRVLFTSTGVVLGSDSWLWKAGDMTLRRAHVHHGTVPIIVLTFARQPFGRERLALPIPEGLESDVEELAELLNRSIVGKMGLS